MADKKLNIKVQTKGAKKAKRELGGVEKAMGSLGKKALAAGGAFFAAQGIISGLTKAIELSSKMEGLQRGFDNLTKSAEFTSQTFDKLKKATDGTMSSMDLMKQANNAMLLGIFESDDQMAKMFDTAQRLAQALGKDAAFGIESLVTGMGRQSKLMLDNLGIMVKAEDAYKRYAAELHKSVSELTDMERKQAFVNEAMKEANKLVKSLGAEQLTTADKISQMKTAVSDASIAVGDLLAPVVVKMAEGFKGAAEAVAEYITQLRLSNTVLEGIVDTDERILVIEAKLAEARKMSITSERDGLIIKGKVTEKAETIAELEEQLALARGGNFFELDQAGQAELNRLQEIIDANVARREEFSRLAALQDESEEDEMLGDVLFTEKELAAQREANAEIQKKIAGDKKKILIDELKQAALVQGSAEDAMKAVVRAESMEAVAGLISSIFKTVPFPFNLILAAGAGAIASKAIDQGLSSFAQGGQFVTSGAEAIVVGDNPSGRERVTVEPLGGDPGFSAGGVNITFNSPVMSEDYTEQTIIPQIKEAIRRGADIGIS